MVVRGWQVTNECYLVDCMDFMKTKPDNYYDLAIVDPPYGIGAGKGTEIYIKNNKWKTDKIKNNNTIYGNWDKAIPEKIYFEELFRISKNQIIWGGNYFTDYLYPVSSWIVWNKLNGNSFFADGELAWTSFKTKLRIFNYLSCGFMGNHKNREKRIHPTQKPVALAKWSLQNYAKPDWKILDTHVGSGYMRIACHDMGFWFEGTEIDQDYWQAQEKRYQNHIANAEIFGKSEMQELIYQGGLYE